MATPRTGLNDVDMTLILMRATELAQWRCRLSRCSYHPDVLAEARADVKIYLKTSTFSEVRGKLSDAVESLKVLDILEGSFNSTWEVDDAPEAFAWAHICGSKAFIDAVRDREAAYDAYSHAVGTALDNFIIPDLFDIVLGFSTPWSVIADNADNYDYDEPDEPDEYEFDESEYNEYEYENEPDGYGPRDWSFASSFENMAIDDESDDTDDESSTTDGEGSEAGC